MKLELSGQIFKKKKF